MKKYYRCMLVSMMIVIAVAILSGGIAANAREIVIKDKVTGAPTAWTKPADKTPAVMIAPVGSVGVVVDAPKLWENFKKACEPRMVKYSYYEHAGQFEGGQLYAAAGMLDAGGQTVKGEGVIEEKPGFFKMAGQTIADNPGKSTIALGLITALGVVAAQNNWFGLAGSKDSKDSAPASVPVLPATSVTGNGNTVTQTIVIQQTTGGNPAANASAPAPAPAPVAEAAPAL